MLRQAGDVEVGALDGLRAGPGERDLEVETLVSQERERGGGGGLTFIVLFCSRNPFRVWIALEASSCR